MAPFSRMDMTAEAVAYGCTVDDVLRLLPGVMVAEETAPVSDAGNPLYAGSAPSRGVSRGDVEAFISQVSARVSARLWRLGATPEVFRVGVLGAARDVVSNGAAHYVQAAVYPAASTPNNGTGYAERLWERFQTGLDGLAADVDAVLASPGAAVVPDVGASGARVSSAAPEPMFPDGMRF